MPSAIAFDVYGTLVDPLEMGERLRPVVGDGLAEPMAQLWREKQLEYTFRRGLMRSTRTSTSAPVRRSTIPHKPSGSRSPGTSGRA